MYPNASVTSKLRELRTLRPERVYAQLTPHKKHVVYYNLDAPAQVRTAQEHLQALETGLASSQPLQAVQAPQLAAASPPPPAPPEVIEPLQIAALPPPPAPPETLQVAAPLQVAVDGPSLPGPLVDRKDYDGYSLMTFQNGDTLEGPWTDPHGATKEINWGVITERWSGDVYIGPVYFDDEGQPVKHGQGFYLAGSRCLYGGFTYPCWFRDNELWRRETRETYRLPPMTNPNPTEPRNLRSTETRIVHGTCTHQGATYVGDLLDGVPHGVGKLTWAANRWYEGEFLHGKRDGLGKLYSPDPVVADQLEMYEGEFRANEVTGWGKTTWVQDGKPSSYEGPHIRGAMTGKGTKRTPTCVMEGEFVNGVRSGRCKVTYHDEPVTIEGVMYQPPGEKHSQIKWAAALLNQGRFENRKHVCYDLYVGEVAFNQEGVIQRQGRGRYFFGRSHGDDEVAGRWYTGTWANNRECGPLTLME